MDLCDSAGVSIYRMDIRLECLSTDPPPVAAMPVALPPPEAPLPVHQGSCPSCGGARVQRSKAQTFIERLRRDHTEAKLYRCQSCGWRGWMQPFEPPAHIEPATSVSVDLADIDAALIACRRTASDPTTREPQ